jgi:methanogenic corrinoid protein MtbC1
MDRRGITMKEATHSEWTSLLGSAEALQPVPSWACLAYHRNLAAMIADVDRSLEIRADLPALIGPDADDLMRDNHRNHAGFLDNVFFLGNFELLARTLPWVYRVYSSRGFSLDYFPVELRAWQESIKQRIPAHQSAPILAVYQWMLDQHGVMSLLYQEKSDQELTPTPPQDLEFDALVAALVAGDKQESERWSKHILGEPWDLERYYLQVLDPVLRRIGFLWESQQINTAQEHIASSLVTRMMSSAYSRMDPNALPHHRAVVSAGPSEQHQIGAWMVADLLEIRGWDTRFLGADTPANDLVQLVAAFQPQVLALSITMPFNLRRGAELIRELRQQPSGKDLKIMVGGQVFLRLPDLAASIGADGWAADARGACLLAESWMDTPTP